ncbi:MAG: hypothetical protein RR347_05290 [Anaerovoracaceae bacterium]
MLGIEKEDAYRINASDIDDLIYKAKIYNKTFIGELLTNFGALNFDKYEIECMVFGKNFSKDDYGKKPLSKLTHDVL